MTRYIDKLVGLSAIAFFCVMAWQMRWIGDDGLINVRVVDHLLAGYGPVFNVGERVEVYTSALWVFLLALLGQLGIRPDTGAVYLGFLLSTTGMLLALAGALSLQEKDEARHRWIPLPLGLCVYAALPPAWEYATSGLENGLGLAWLGGSFFALASRASRSADRPFRPAPYLYCALLGLGPLIRPELAIFSLGMAVPLIMGWPIRTPDAPRSRVGLLFFIAKCGLAMAVLPLAYQIFRMGYFAALTPNTAIAKEAFESRWLQGWYYFDNLFCLYRLAVPLVPLLVFFAASLRRAKDPMRRATLIAPVACGALYCLYVVKMGGDFMHGRLLLPGLFGFLLPMAAVSPEVPWRAKWAPVLNVLMAVLILAWMGYCASSIRMSIANQNGIGDEHGWYTRRSVDGHPTAVEDYRRFEFFKDGRQLRERATKWCGSGMGIAPKKKESPCSRRVLVDTPGFGRLKKKKKEAGYPIDPAKVAPEVVMAALRGPLGIIGVVTGAHIHLVDRFGIADPIGSRLSVPVRGRPGHEKTFSNAWLVARFAKASDDDDPKVTAARQALACSPLPDLIAAVRGPLTAGRFLSNIGRAFRFQTLRIPSDPRAAKKAFCD